MPLRLRSRHVVDSAPGNVLMHSGAGGGCLPRHGGGGLSPSTGEEGRGGLSPARGEGLPWHRK